MIEIETNEFDTTILQSPIITQLDSKKACLEYYPLSVSVFACFPSTCIEGVELDGVDI